METGQDAAIQPSDPSLEIVFDTTSGISLEEQQEILAGINAMSGGKRLVPQAAVTEAKKRGIVFPLLVNVFALLLLVLGFKLLSHFQVQDEQSIRDNSATLGHTERALIQEIRHETNRQISEKDDEINDILSKLSAADAEYKVLQGSVESLTGEQRERAAALLQMQEEYRSTLADLSNEKAGILEDSRQREARIKAQAEEKAKELSSQIEQKQASLEQSQANLYMAIEELQRLSTEQERISRAESQMAGYYATANNQINSGLLDEACVTLEAMKEFLAAPSLQGIRSLEARKQTHYAAIAAMEGAVAEACRLKEGRAGGTDQALVDLQARYDALERKAADQEQALAAFGSQDTEQGRIIMEFENRINELRTANINQQETLNRRDTEIVSLRTENAEREQQVSELNSSITALSSQNEILVRQYDDLQRRMDAAVRAFQGE